VDTSTGLISTVVDIPTACNCSSSFFDLVVMATDTGGRVDSVLVNVYITETTTMSSTIATDRYFSENSSKWKYIYKVIGLFN